MADKVNWEKRLSDNSLTILVAILLIAVISALIVVGVYLYYFSGIPVKVDPAPWGQFGDFFGGTLNPIFGFLSVMALLAALVIQGRELKVSSEELKNSALALGAQNKAIAHQSFEQTFFSWLENYREMLSSIHDENLGRESVGRAAIREWWMVSLSCNAVFRAAKVKNNDLLDEFGFPVISSFERTAQDFPMILTSEALDCWDRIYQENEYQLDSLFRNLYRLILWIDSQHDVRMSASQKWLYVSIVRAQLSWIEMVYLYYNGYTARGRNFKRLMEKYALFDNLNFESDPMIAHIRKNEPIGNQYADTTYNSRLARKKIGLPESAEDTLAMAVV